MSWLNANNCYLYERHNFSIDVFESYKVEKWDFVVNQFSFGLPWLKLLICLIGIATNVLNIAVLIRPYASSSINIQFVVLECVNLVWYTSFFHEFAMFFNKDLVLYFSGEISVYTTIAICLQKTCSCASNWLTVSVGVWRFLAITFPFKATTYCNKYRSKVVVSSIILLSIALWTYYCFWFECLLYVYELTDGNYVVQEVAIRIIANLRIADESYNFRLYYPIMALFSTAVPCTLLIVVSIALIRRIWMARRASKAIRRESVKEIAENNARELRMTLALTAMILTYLLANLPESIVSVMYWFYPQIYIQSFFVCRLAWNRYGLLLCNVSTTCFYCVMSERLRQTYTRFLALPFSMRNPTKTKGHFVNSFISSNSVNSANSTHTSQTSVM